MDIYGHIYLKCVLVNPQIIVMASVHEPCTHYAEELLKMTVPRSLHRNGVIVNGPIKMPILLRRHLQTELMKM